MVLPLTSSIVAVSVALVFRPDARDLVMAAKTRLSWACTLEFVEQAPETARGEFEVPNARLGARRALEAAQKQYPNRKWASVSILLERKDRT